MINGSANKSPADRPHEQPGKHLLLLALLIVGLGSFPNLVAMGQVGFVPWCSRCARICDGAIIF